MTPELAYSLISAGESETVEFKETTNSTCRQKAAEALCAMLNHKGGVVLFGVSDDRRVLGQQISNGTIKHVVEELRKIDPPVFPSIAPVDLGGDRFLITVSVGAGANGVHTYKGVAYRRTGTSNFKLSRDEYNRLLLEKLHSQSRWENELAQGWTVQDLDLSEVARTVDEGIRRGRIEELGTRDPLTILGGLQLLNRDGSLTRAAAVLFGKRERLERDFAQCLLRVAWFRTESSDEFLDNQRFHGNAFALLHEAQSYLMSRLPVAGRIVPGVFEREDQPLFPTSALREALANAICHRDYSIGGGGVQIEIYRDRLEISSPGPLHFGLTPAALQDRHSSLPWNPLIANVFFRRGVIEEFGTGTLRMAEMMRRAGYDPPVITCDGASVRVCFRPERQELAPF